MSMVSALGLCMFEVSALHSRTRRAKHPESKDERMDSAGKPFAYTIVLLLLQASRYTFTFSRSALHDALASS